MICQVIYSGLIFFLLKFRSSELFNKLLLNDVIVFTYKVLLDVTNTKRTKRVTNLDQNRWILI